MTNPFYQKHLFFCLHQREGEAACGNSGDAEAMLTLAKTRSKDLGLQDTVRVNRAGCLGRCELGPVAVLYPQGVWYTYVDAEDVLDIVESHLRDDQTVERLVIDVGTG